MTEYEVTLHWLYVAVMFGSAVAFMVMSRDPKTVPQYKYLIHIMVVVWSGLAYSALAMGQGTTEVAGDTVMYARYIDWVVTTPLLLLSLTLTGKYTIQMHGPVTAGLMGSQVIMIVTGLVAELSTGFAKWYWYIAGCIALLVVLWLFWGPLLEKAKSQDKAIEDVYRKSATYLTVQWLAYPLVWLIGTQGLGLLNTTATTTLFILLPIISKAGFGFFNLMLLRNLPDSVKRQITDEMDPHLSARPGLA
ncbi:bacteriorhodopsin [Nibrella saemangeumensis]|uniref:Bacteriorhodopsin n=1 Tax=Nibrella saemangeumensis TaxID=1084526 RepID=A0ABP8NI60_9BACT